LIRRGRRTLGAAAALALLGTAAAAGEPPPPDPCVLIAPGTDLGEALDALPEGGALCLGPGEYTGPVVITRRVTLWGPREATLRSQGAGTTVSIHAAGSELVGFTIDGSGGRHDLLDAAVRIRADGVRVEGVAIQSALFGILVEECREVRILRNEIRGNADAPLGMRGDAIRIWEVRESLIEGNRIEDSRDLVIWYSPGNRIVGNEVTRGRYGTHLMYSHDNQLLANVYRHNVVGIFVMYSRGLRVHRNIFGDSLGAAGMGFGAKESGSLELTENWLVGNTVGIWLDTSPLDLRNGNVFRRNVLRLGDTGVVFHGRVEGNRFERNSFRDNGTAVRVEGRGDARAALWWRNDFDDYAGYDLDGDGIGDLPYELRSLSGELTARTPSIAFFTGSLAMALVEVIGRLVPLFQPQVVLVDPEPSMAPLVLKAPDAG